METGLKLGFSCAISEEEDAVEVGVVGPEDGLVGVTIRARLVEDLEEDDFREPPPTGTFRRVPPRVQ